MIDVYELLHQICEDDRVYDREIDLVESGLLDSLAVIELFSFLEEQGIELQPTRIDRQLLHSVKGIQTLIEAAQNEKESQKWNKAQ